jgi:hypothetical protein
VIAEDQVLSSGKFFEYATSFIVPEEGKVAQNIDDILLPDRRVPQLQQPIIVGFNVICLGKGPIFAVPKYVLVSKVQVCCKVNLVHRIVF